MSEGAERRIDYLLRAVDVAAAVKAEAVSFWSGVRPVGTANDVVWDRLVSGSARVLEAAARRGVRLGFEPEPGMMIDTIERYEMLRARLGSPAELGLTLDVGHCRCVEDASAADCVRRAGSALVNVQIDDMRRGVHEHLEFGAGEIEFPPVLEALGECGYRGLISVELPRHGHEAPEVARRSLSFLQAAAAAPLAVPR